jgi:hypothetical protein
VVSPDGKLIAGAGVAIDVGSFPDNAQAIEVQNIDVCRSCDRNTVRIYRDGLADIT